MNKARIVEQIADSLRESLKVLDKAARASHAEATHESSKAESKYDTRGLEAAYLAAGQAGQARELASSIELYETLAVKNFGRGEPIDTTALVEVVADGERALYFIGPKNGGLEIELQGKLITVITASSPLGQSLIGKKSGQSWTNKLGGVAAKFKVAAVW